MNRLHAKLSFSTAVPAFREASIDLLATAGTPPGFGAGIRAPGRFGYEFLRSCRIGIIGDPYLGPAFDRRNLPTPRTEEVVSKDARDSVGLEKVLHGGY